jgi:site-specific recombinase XerD
LQQSEDGAKSVEHNCSTMITAATCVVSDAASCAAVQLCFCALLSFDKYLIRRAVPETSPIKNLALPKLDKRLPKFLTPQRMLDSIGIRP